MSDIKKKSPIWHPFTQHALFPEMTHIARGDGAYLYTKDGHRLIDGISSWWVVTHGHCHPRLQAAAKAQMEKLDQVIFAGYTHDPAEEVARGMVDLTPDGLDYVFFSDSGSTSVEVALKMALGYWYHIGSKRSKILVMENSYHGDTIGTMSVGERGVYNNPYNSLLFTVDCLPFPAKGAEQETLDQLEAKIKADPDGVAAFIVEPLIQGAGGMMMYSAETLREMHRICQEHDVLFIADEVMTGWGRTGTLFACEQAGIVPDIACYSKGITGGFLPLAVTMCHERIFNAHYSEDRSKTFFHSSSYTANPIACAVAAENIRMWQDEPVMERVSRLASSHANWLEALARDDRVENLRQCGTIAAFDIKVTDGGYLSDIAPRLYRYFQENGILLRPLGNTVYLMTPYCLSDDDLSHLYGTIGRALDDLS
ncbi:adenosylmethionine--8-amino-7-oxononanoate transaminase [Aestuariispira insulae]|uniref:Adenosylmethionine-8-amino-7-oxononanoate aminotransferase n=1 Tax=Aestuariispira insulae TaxID=1461337 RepID=A0A3D9HVN5_9PROT|nr:adenosylmethionine--8-amino-7-oxononanoate transaminase [Aestuariispira insulae]RED53558.1 adenosylmethionine-8-amino-7-oxononanoate aminotransferase [Aestuariispira insulae]